jgi:hypothetical protein
MHNDTFYLLGPVFRFLDAVIYNYGDLLYLLLVYVSIPLIVWILRGGLGRRMGWHRSGTTTHIIVVRDKVQPPPLPPDVGGEAKRREMPSGDDEGGDSFAA